MAVNDKQKIAVLDINTATKQTIENYLLQGYVILHLAVLDSLSKLLIVYATPEQI